MRYPTPRKGKGTTPGGSTADCYPYATDASTKRGAHLARPGVLTAMSQLTQYHGIVFKQLIWEGVQVLRHAVRIVNWFYFNVQ
jgi:hypothetical protein